MIKLKDKTQAIRNFSSAVLSAQTEISVNWDLAEELSQTLKRRSNTINTQTDSGELYLERQVGLILLYGAVHYCFTNPKSKKEYVFEQEGKKLSRSLGFITALKSSNVPWEDFGSVRTLTLDAWHTILQTADPTDLYDLNERHQKILSFCSFLLEYGVRNASEFMEKYQTANAVIELLEASDLFADPFLKRAQVTAYLLSATLEKYQKSGYPDIDLLTAMPDYRLPQLLINTDIAVIPEQLKESLLKQELVAKDSSYEQALRAAVVVVVQKISHDISLSECAVDSLMWGLAQEYKNAGTLKIPAMLVETDCY